MQNIPPQPAIDDAPGLLDSGHLWLQEFVDGQPFRFQLGADDRPQFGDSRRNFTGDDAPRAYRHAVHHVQRALDRSALRDAVEDTETVTFVGVATQRNRLDYDWEQLPSVLVTDIHDAGGQHDANTGDNGADTGHFLPPARVEQVAERLGLVPVNAIEKEVRATDFDPTSYEFPDSAWRDGPVAGVVLRNKTGQRAILDNETVLDGAEPEAGDGSAVDSGSDSAADGDSTADIDAAVAEYASEARYRRVSAALEVADRSVSFDAVQERVLDGVYREHAPQFCEGRPPVEHAAFEQAVARQTSEFLAE